jgi:hypothetical protein
VSHEAIYGLSCQACGQLKAALVVRWVAAAPGASQHGPEWLNAPAELVTERDTGLCMTGTCPRPRKARWTSGRDGHDTPPATPPEVRRTGR